MSDVDRDQQALAWEMRLSILGVPASKVAITRQLAEQIMSALEAVGDAEIEDECGFGDYTRGIATIAAMVAIEWVGTPSA